MENNNVQSNNSNEVNNQNTNMTVAPQPKLDKRKKVILGLVGGGILLAVGVLVLHKIGADNVIAEAGETVASV